MEWLSRKIGQNTRVLKVCVCAGERNSLDVTTMPFPKSIVASEIS